MNELIYLFIHSLFIYLCNVTDSIFQCVFTVYSVVWSLNLSLVMLFM